MATPFPRPRRSGKTAWYGKLCVHGIWKNVLLKGCKTEKQAQKMLDELEHEYARLDKGLDPGRKFRGTFHELCEWAYEVHYKGLRGWRAEKSRVKCHAGPTSPLGKLPAERVTSDAIEKYLDAYADAPTVRGKLPSPDSLNRIRDFFVGVFSQAQSHGIWPDDNPARRIAQREVVRDAFSILALHEIVPVIEHTPEYWRGCIAVGLLAGLRKGEILALRKSDVHLAQRAIMVQRSNEFHRTKGSKQAEKVPIHEDLVRYLEPWLAKPGPLVFPKPDGSQRGRGAHLEIVLRRAMVRAGLCDWHDHVCRRCPHTERHADAEQRRCPDCNMKLWPVGHARYIRFHDTRHTFASQALMSGASVHDVQKMLRHKDPRLTANTYGHLTPDHLAEAVNRIRLPGANGGEPTRTPEASGDRREHTIPDRKAAEGSPSGLGAPVVRALPPTHRPIAKPALVPLSQLAGETPSLFSVRASHNVPAVVQGSQPLATVHDPCRTTSRRSRPFAPVSEHLGAPVVRGKTDAHQNAETEKPPRSGLLTVRDVAERLNVKAPWVYKRLASGELLHVREGARVLVPEHVVDAYLERFAGLRRPAVAVPAAPPAAAPARRKGAR